MRTSKIQIAITKDKDCFNIYIYYNSAYLSKIIQVFIHQQTQQFFSKLHAYTLRKWLKIAFHIFSPTMLLLIMYMVTVHTMQF